MGMGAGQGEDLSGGLRGVVLVDHSGGLMRVVSMCL